MLRQIGLSLPQAFEIAHRVGCGSLSGSLRVADDENLVHMRVDGAESPAVVDRCSSRRVRPEYEAEYVNNLRTLSSPLLSVLPL